MSTDIDAPAFIVLDRKPVSRKPGGKAKKGLTLAIENLEVGQTLFTGLSVAGFESGSKDHKRIMGNVRSKTGAITKARHEANLPCLFSVTSTENDPDLPDGSVVVERKQ